MSDIRVIAASAGTGKTHRLAQELVQALVDKSAGIEPEGVVAVTYTRAAAAELEARVRQALIEAGEPLLAQRLVLARIGTVHSVCARLVEEHAFSLGMSPELATVDERAAAAMFDDALQAVMSDADRIALDDLEQRCRGVPFEQLCRSVIDRARSNDLDVDALRASCASSKATLLANLPDARDPRELERELKDALDIALTRFLLSERAAAAARDEHARLSRARDTLARGEPLPWSDWLRLEDSRVRKEAVEHIRHPQLGRDLCRFIDLVFDTAERALLRFADDKKQRGVVDFVDQEKLALALFANDDTRAAIGASVQLLLVDEFQDTSPLQLALFQALAQVAQRTVVVGDTKQSIFGFRDASPDLFVRFQEQATVTDRLDVSHRSRKGLVDAVSAVFGAAFAAAGLDRDDVVLRAKDDIDVDDDALGAHVERWWEEPTSNDPHQESEKRSDEDLASAGVAELLTSRGALVRATGGGVRPAQARDIAILCRTNAACRAMADALAARGVPVLLRRRGLAKTLEARVVSAGLSLWLDQRDSLAAAALVRMLEGEGDDLVAHVVAAEPGRAFADHPSVKAITDAAINDRRAGVVAAFDAVVRLLRLRDELPRFGKAAQRLADLAALRALAVRFVDAAVDAGRGPTVAGYLARLEALRTLRDDDDDPDDERGDVAGIDAVSVLTWHKSKGREWPITVLTGLWRSGWVAPFDVAVESSVELPSLEAPLFGRTLRVWPSPYGGGAGGGLAKHLLVIAPQLQRAKRNAKSEDLRLLYVAFTRAKDRIVVVGDGMVWQKGMMEALTHDKRALCSDPAGNAGVARWGDGAHLAPVQMVVHAPAASARASVLSAESMLPPAPVSSTKTPRAPAAVQPSAQVGEGRAGESIPLGAPISTDRPLAAGTDAEREELNHIGQMVHAFLAVDAFTAGAAAGEGVDVDVDARRAALALRVRKAFVVEDLLSTNKVKEIGRRLWRGLDARFPGHKRKTEVPLLQRLPTGSLVRGFIDLLVETDAGFVIVDHKNTFDDDVSGYAGQLVAYASAVRAATGKPVVGLWIHLPLLGRLVEVVVDDA